MHRLLLLAAGLSRLLFQAAAVPPVAQGPIERVGVDLILLDVEARDASGGPLRGLKPEDFEVLVNGVHRDVYSADDRCGCGDAVSPPWAGAPGPSNPGRSARTEHVDGDPAAPPSGAAAIPPADLEPALFIFYFDFALMDLDGRTKAIGEASRWIRETMRDGDQVMIVGATFAGGAVTLAKATSDPAALLAALARMKASREFVDPHVSFYFSRKRECDQDWNDPVLGLSLPHCNINAMDEYIHTRGTLKTLARFMDTLDAIPGHKQLVLFHQMAPFKPAALYPGARLTSTQEPAVAEAGAAAVAARVTIHAAGTDGAELVGTLAAEYTGGTYNRSASDLSQTLDAMRSRCACIYRIGIVPREKEKGRAVTVTVVARNRTIANLRVKVRTAADRWLNQARHVLADPGAARDLPVSAAVIPIAAAGKGWTVKVQIAVHAAAITKIPESHGSQAQWEAGALLTLEGSPRSWEMLAESSMRAPSGSTAPEWLVHERTLENLPPGTYRLGAFVRDRTVDLFGGASTVLHLVEPSAAGAVGPIPLLAQRRILILDLPLRGAAPSGATRGVKQSDGLVPSGDSLGGAEDGPPLEVMTWLCGIASTSRSPAAVDRYLTSESAVSRRLPGEGAWTEAGSCMRLTDRLEADLISESPARYHLRLNGSPGATPIDVEAGLP